jgi:hypothetical protein
MGDKKLYDIGFFSPMIILVLFAIDQPLLASAQIHTQSFSTGTLNCIQHPSNTAVINFNNTEWQISASPNYRSFGPITNVVFNNGQFTVQGRESSNEGYCANEYPSEVQNVAVTISGACGNNVPIMFVTNDVKYSIPADQNGTFTGNVVCPTTVVPLPSAPSPSHGTIEAYCIQYHDNLQKTVDDCHRMFNGNTPLQPGAVFILCYSAKIAGSFFVHVGPLMDLLHC